MNRCLTGVICGMILFTSACATQPHAERAAISLPDHPLSFMFGEWAGTAKGVGFDRKPFEITQTERVGPILEGGVTVIEGRGYGASGDLSFNAFAIVSYDKRREEWEIRSYTDGYAGTFPFEPTQSGYVWSTPAGPDAMMRYTAEFEGDTWYQIGEYVPASGEPQQTFEMTLKRIGDTNWPSAGVVLPPAIAN